MRKIIMFNRVSLDAFFAGPNGETHQWFINDPKIDKAAHRMINPDTVLFGRITYEIFESFWPHAAADKKAPKEMQDTGKELNAMNKIVFSHRLDKVNWENTELKKGDLISEVKKLKRKKGGDIVIFGSGTIVRQLTDAGLIDEYLLVLTPVILGDGQTLFDGKTVNMELIASKSFDSGNVMIHYKLANKKKKK